MDNLTWIKSTYSGGSGGNCVEVAAQADGVAVRDSKDRNGALLTFSPAEWEAFTTTVKMTGGAL